jgi:hypothetical protein
MKTIKTSLFFAMILVFASCAKVYYSPESELLAKSHNVIAVAMPRVVMAPQKNVSADDLNKMSKSEGESIHQSMTNWLWKRKSQGKINVEVLDASTTSAKLATIPEGKILTPAEQADLLEVDAILTSTYKMSKPMSTGAAIATTILFGFGTTNEVRVNMELIDRKSKKMLMTFEHTVSGGLLNSADDLVNEVMRIASKKLPYTKFAIK